MKKKETEEEKTFGFYSIFVIIALISFIGYTIIEIIKFESFLNFLPKLLGIGLILLFLICFIVISLKNKKKSIPIIIGSIIITIYSIFNILLTLGVVNLPYDEIVPNFYNKPFSEVNEWKKENNITIIENYEYSDTITKFYVISQDALYPTLTKDITEMTITISLGPDPEKEIVVPNFIGLSFTEVIKFIDENYLTNVEIVYEESTSNEDTVITQDNSGTLKRNSPIKITFAKGEAPEEVKVIDLEKKTILYATAWLNKYGFKVTTKYEFSDKVESDIVIKQNIKDEVVKPLETEIILTVSKGKMLIAPDFAKMSVDEINEWIINNNLKIRYLEEYNETVKLGDVISSSKKKDEIIEKGESIDITISKGSLKMIKISSINEFVNWATNNHVDYNLNYEYSNSVSKDQIINASHKEGDIIKNDDTVILTISKGKSISIPNFVGMSKTNIQNKCNELNLNCSFKTGSYTEKTAKDVATSQSKNSGTVVSEGTNLVITLSAGIYEKVNVPSFNGKTKSQISSECQSLGINCNFNYQSGYSDTPKDTCVSQSQTGTVNKGSTINITLSNGPAQSYNVIIDANQLSSGNPEATKATLESKLKNACPGVTFNFKFEKANSGIGYLAPSSDVKVGSNTLIQGHTYNVIINSN